MLPLYKGALNAKKGANFHAGLWYEVFFNFYDHAYKITDEGKLKWIQTVTQSPVGDSKVLADATRRQQAVVNVCGGSTLMMTTDWHFVTGLGNNHPVENGFAWHHTLGVPYLTGAAVKGMVRAWCEIWEEFDDEKIKHWFGGAGDEQAAGELIFFDALPAEPVQLKADIMTPHYGDWYAKGDESLKADGSNIPADWHDPVPVPFLVVDKGASFQFSVGKRAGSSIDVGKVVQALKGALEWLGAGAKTSAGYGRFSEDEQAKRIQQKAEKEREEQEAQEKLRQEQEARRANMSPLQAELDKWVSVNPEPNTVAQWLNGIDKRSEEDKRQIAEVLKAYYEQRGSWKKPSQKQKANVQKIKGML